MSDLFDFSGITPSPEYLALRDYPHYASMKLRAQEFWAIFEPFADSQFRAEFALHMHPRFWEMYLGAWLASNSAGLVPRRTAQGPDFHIVRNGQDIWVEATAPDDGSGADAVPSIYGRGYDPVPQEKMVLRFTNAIAEKLVKHTHYTSEGIIGPNDPFVIAINGGGIPMTLFDEPMPAIIKSVYPFGQYSITFRADTLETLQQGFHRRNEVAKKSGSTVPTTLFLDAASKGVSGVLYSTATLWDLPPIPGHEFLYIHNLVATSPLEPNLFGIGRECVMQGDKLTITDHNAGT
jgi:hypothetical protein